MAERKTKAQILAEIASNVYEVHESSEVNPNDRPGGLRTYDVICTIDLNTEGTLKNKVTQRMYVKNEGTVEESAWLGGKLVESYKDSNVDLAEAREQELLAKLTAIEAKIGKEIKVDPTELRNLGIQFFVYIDPDTDIKYVTTSLSGTEVTRVAV